MADIFISYSRKNINFARILHKTLVDNNFEPWIDWQDIAPSTDWLNEVYEAIEQCGIFIYIISRFSTESEICNLEIEHAIKNKKRIIPVVIDDPEPKRVNPEIAALNWLFFSRREDFNESFRELVKTIQTDYEWVKEHTRLQIRALEWVRNKRNSGYLPRGLDLVEAEQWIAQAQGKDPQPTSLQEEFIAAGRQAAARQRRIKIGLAATAVLVIVTALLSAYFIQSGIIRQEQAAQLSLELHQAIRSEDTEAVLKAIDAGADVNASTEHDHLTPLHQAANLGNTELAAILIAAGADVNARTGTGDADLTPLFVVVMYGHTELAALLIAEGADVEAITSEHHWTPLHWAVITGHTDMVSLLIEAGADLNARSRYELTPLHWLATEGNTEVAMLLIEAGAEVNARDINGQTALYKAERQGHTALATLIRQNGGID